MATTSVLTAAGSAVREGVAVATRVLAGDPGIKPNTNGLPGLNVLQQMVGALLTWGLLACLAGLVISVMMWALAHHQGNYSQVSSGKTGVLVSAGGALLIGGANAIIGFFSTLGAGIR
jgi:hypothetical protein